MSQEGRVMRRGVRVTCLLTAALAASAILSGTSIDDDYARWDQEQTERADAITFPLDDAYLHWETEQAALADKDLTRRLALDAQVKQTLAINSEYARWEASKAEDARAELERKAARRIEAADALAQAEENARIAKEKAESARAEDREEAQRLAEESEAQRLEAQRQLDIADSDQTRAQEAALEEAKAQQAANLAAIKERNDTHNAKMDRAQNITAIPEKTVYASDNVAARSGPAAPYDELGTIPKGQAITVNGSVDQFWRTTDGMFVSQRYTSDTPPSSSGTQSPSSAATSAPESQHIKWTTFVGNSNGQAAVDACTKGLTKTMELTEAMGAPYYSIHNTCDGAPILELQVGDRVLIKNVGIYEVVDSRDVQRGDKANVLDGLKGDIYLQTCYFGSSAMRVVALNTV